MNDSPISRRGFLAGSLAACAVPSLLGAIQPDEADDVAWLAEVQRPPEKLPNDAPKLPPILVDDEGEAITSLDGWLAKRESIGRWWLEFLQPLTVPPSPPPPLDVIEEDRDEGVIRQLVRYESEPGLATEAYLVKPAEVRGRAPGVAVFHSTVNHSIRQPAGVEGKPEKAFGLKLAKKGCVAICPRNFLWPTNHAIAANEETKRFHDRWPDCKGMAKMLHDAHVAVDILCAMPEVDIERIGAIGHSLGAKEVLYLAAFDERVKVTVSSEGGVGTRFSNWDAPWYLGPSIRGDDFTREHHELLALAAPRPFLLLGGDSADGDRSWPFIESAMPVWRLYGGRPRLGLFNHKQGHSVPPEAERRIYEWLDVYL